jgi:asparagine synthase (glutamine-hydrolysing)
MCGIAGIIGKSDFNSDKNLNRILLTLNHRGPDESGDFYDSTNGIRIGVCRLSIIDSKGPCQPICNEDKTLWIVCNGEIYNHQEIRRLCENLGHVFYTKCDVEVILHLYEEFGLDCLGYLRGMFAFALCDIKRNIVVLARDRLGVKPLVYSYDQNRLVFASEIQSLSQFPEMAGEISTEAIHHYLTFSYIPSPLSIYNKIRKLPPAHYLIYSNGEIKLKKYWSLSFLPKLKISYEDAQNELFKRLSECVEIRMNSDRQVGIFLSGGLDSSVITALASNSRNGIETFSVGFDVNKYDETKWARQVSEKFGTKHHVVHVDSDALDLLPGAIGWFGEPFGDYSSIPMLLLSETAKTNITVALTGDGGDELFAGYTRYLSAFKGDNTRLPVYIRNQLIEMCKVLPIDHKSKTNLTDLLLESLCSTSHFNDSRYPYRMRYLQNELAKWSLYSPCTLKELLSINSMHLFNRYFSEAPASSFIEKLQYVDFNKYLPDNNLYKVDICSMRHSVETRSPFLDHTLIEFVACLPIRYKIKGEISRRILKDTLKDILPESIYSRPKQPFRIPIREWLMQNKNNYVSKILLSDRCLSRGYFNPESIISLVNKFSNNESVNYQIWTLLTLELWFQSKID